jgi:hypothetical protein
MTVSFLLHRPLQPELVPGACSLEPFCLTALSGLRSIEGAGGWQKSVLTGFNTEIEFDGVSYHVQTEDRGQNNPLIESLVYVRGEILANRRTEYRDLIDAGADLASIQVLMERQHRAIVEAIRSGRIDLLTEPPVGAEGDTTVSRKGPGLATRPLSSAIEAAKNAQKSLDEVISDWLAEQDRDERIRLRVVGGDDLHFGKPFKLQVSVQVSPTEEAVGEARLMARFLSTEMKPQKLADGVSDAAGAVELSGTIPTVTKGQGLLVISVQHARGNDEVKFLVRK